MSWLKLAICDLDVACVERYLQEFPVTRETLLELIGAYSEDFKRNFATIATMIISMSTEECYNDAILADLPCKDIGSVTHALIQVVSTTSRANLLDFAVWNDFKHATRIIVPYVKDHERIIEAAYECCSIKSFRAFSEILRRNRWLSSNIRVIRIVAQLGSWQLIKMLYDAYPSETAINHMLLRLAFHGRDAIAERFIILVRAYYDLTEALKEAVSGGNCGLVAMLGDLTNHDLSEFLHVAVDRNFKSIAAVILEKSDVSDRIITKSLITVCSGNMPRMFDVLKPYIPVETSVLFIDACMFSCGAIIEKLIDVFRPDCMCLYAALHINSQFAPDRTGVDRLVEQIQTHVNYDTPKILAYSGARCGKVDGCAGYPPDALIWAHIPSSTKKAWLDQLDPEVYEAWMREIDGTDFCRAVKYFQCPLTDPIWRAALRCAKPL